MPQSAFFEKPIGPVVRISGEPGSSFYFNSMSLTEPPPASLGPPRGQRTFRASTRPARLRPPRGRSFPGPPRGLSFLGPPRGRSSQGLREAGVPRVFMRLERPRACARPECPGASTRPESPKSRASVRPVLPSASVRPAFPGASTKPVVHWHLCMVHTPLLPPYGRRSHGHLRETSVSRASAKIALAEDSRYLGYSIPVPP